ncbi:MAG: ion transporter [Coxiellaceae bacterium]|nr:ion transporter [Coxiellaceae bacterium]
MRAWVKKFNQFWSMALGHKSVGKTKHRMNIVLCVLVIINVIAIVLATSNDLYPWVYHTIYIANFTITVLFAIEYFLRWIYSGIKPFRYLISFASIIDIISIFPALVAYLMGWDLTHLMVFRLLRLYKFFRITKTMQLFNSVMIRSYKKLGFAFLILFVVTIIDSTLIYYAENAAQPHKFSSIIATMWWVVSALTTAGYVPIDPITTWGKILGSCTVIIGVALFAIPAGIISAGFIEEYKIQRRQYAADSSNTKDRTLLDQIEDEIDKDIRNL